MSPGDFPRPSGLLFVRCPVGSPSAHLAQQLTGLMISPYRPVGRVDVPARVRARDVVRFER
jgi:hypothetical protein